jgi:hypothetical protein
MCRVVSDKDQEEEDFRDEEDDIAYPFYDPEYLVTGMYSRKRGLLVQTPDRGEQCIYWAGQELPGGTNNFEKAEKSRTYNKSTHTDSTHVCRLLVHTNNKTFPGLLFITIPPEYKHLADGKIHSLEEVPEDAGTRQGHQSFYGFYFAEGLDPEVR